MKKYLFGILAVALAIGFSAFTNKSANKPFVTKTYIFLPSNDDIRSTETDHLVPGTSSGQIRNGASWDEEASTPSYGTGFKLAAMTFNEDASTGLTKAEAMAGVETAYNAGNVLTNTDNQVISVTGVNGTFNVTLRKKAS